LTKSSPEGGEVVQVYKKFGGHYQYHKEKILCLAQELPVIIEVAESAERIEQILPPAG
jgi:PII-like signaling protein